MGPCLQNLNFFDDFAHGVKDVTNVVGTAADIFDKVAPVAGEVWGSVDPKSFKEYGQNIINDGKTYAHDAAQYSRYGNDAAAQIAQMWGDHPAMAQMANKMQGQQQPQNIILLI